MENKGLSQNNNKSPHTMGSPLASIIVRCYNEREYIGRLLHGNTTIPPTLLTLAGVPVAKSTPGRQTWSRKEVPAAWHRQQSTTPTLWDYPCPTDVVVR